MPLNTQAKLLRALQNQEIQRLGALTPRKVNVRVIAATHRDLRTAVAENHFREDLFYRLTMVELAIPALVEREGDLLLLIRHFINKYATQYNKDIRGLTNRAQMVLLRHHWPGNVRELENVIGHSCIMVMGTTIDVADLPSYLSRGQTDPSAAPIPAMHGNGGELLPLEEQEKRLLMEALRKAGGNQSEAARLLRISRDTLRYRMKKHGIS
jgi:transcriptional regulator with PAS, ATPase and Fis domain